jgi:hypothetical protein
MSPELSAAFRHLGQLLWRIPLIALPMAGFFGTITGGTWLHYVVSYQASLIFGYSIGLGHWVIHTFVLPRVNASRPPGSRTEWIEDGAWFTGVSLLGAAIASVIIHFTVIPGFLGSGRAIASVMMFSTMFTILFGGIFFAITFYRQSLARARAEQELHMARRIQRSFLLSQFPRRPRLEVHALNVSSNEVSGDFYDVVPATDNAFLIAVADVSGKGVPAALLSSMLQASLRTQAMTGVPVAGMLQTINGLVHDRTTPEQFATFFLARVDETRMELTYSNAGHNHPLVFRRDGSQERLDRGGTVIGVLPDAGFEEASCELRTGDVIVLYTDGLSEAENGDGSMLGEDGLVSMMAALPRDLAAREIAEGLLAGLQRHLGGRPAGDDVTLLVMRVLEPPVASPAADGARPAEA